MSEKIIGIREGMKLVRIGVGELGEYRINNNGFVEKIQEGALPIVSPIIAPDNVYGMMPDEARIRAVTAINMDQFELGEMYAPDDARVLPEQWWFREVRTAWEERNGFRIATEHYLSRHFVVQKPGGEIAGPDFRRIILKKKAPAKKKVLVLECDDPDVIRNIEDGADMHLSAKFYKARIEEREVKA